MDFSKDYNDLSKIMVQKFRDEVFEEYKNYRDYCEKTSNSEFYKNQNSNKAKELIKIEEERFEFYKSLNQQQLIALDKLILSIIDNVAFNVLREIEENLEENHSIGLTINGKQIEEISPEFWSGTCFGEYFKWIEQNSKFGSFQH